jgi:uncharacterized protein (DUF58 family)
VEFAEHRQYYSGDEIRHIDWRAYGKTDRYFVKEFEEETNLRAWLIVDCSGSMAYRGKSALGKWETAQRIAAALAYLLLHQMDAVGLILHDSAIRGVLPAKAQPRQLLRICKLLQEAKPGRETHLAEIWQEVSRRYVKRRGAVILLTDAFDDLEKIRVALQNLRHQNQDVVLLQIVAPEEIEFPFAKSSEFRSLENSNRQRLQPRILRDEYLKRFAEHTEGLRQLTARLRIDFIRVRTDESLEIALGAFLRERGMRK